jgi:hypothetical protein
MNPITLYGLPIYPEELEESEIGVIAILEDDRIVNMVGWTRVITGCAGTCNSTSEGVVWEWNIESKCYTGLYKFLTNLLPTISKIKQEKIANKKPYKEWSKMAYSLGIDVLEDEELFNEIQSEGLENWLRNYRC